MQLHTMLEKTSVVNGIVMSRTVHRIYARQLRIYIENLEVLQAVR